MYNGDIFFSDPFRMNDDLPLNEMMENHNYLKFNEHESNIMGSMNEELNRYEYNQYLSQASSELCQFIENQTQEQKLSPSPEPKKESVSLIPLDNNRNNNTGKIKPNAEESKPTDDTSVHKEDEGEDEIENEGENEGEDEGEIPITKTENNKNNLLGRKRRGDHKEGEHTKHKPDNQMRKIKANFQNYTTKKLNSSLSLGHKQFLKIDPKVNEELGIEYNMKLMQMTWKEIFKENSINKRYSKITNEKYNAELIDQIYSEGKETEAIKILDSTYIQYLDHMRKKDLKLFKNAIREKEIKMGNEEGVDEYVEELVKLLFDFEDWFSRKTPRKPKQNIKKKN